MKKKIIVIFTCVVLISTIIPVTGIEDIEEKQLSSCGLPKEINKNYINSEQNQNIFPNGEIGRGKTAYGFQIYPYSQIVSFDLDYPSTIDDIATPVSLDFISGSTWVDGVWWGCEYSAAGNSNIWTIDHISGEMTFIGESGSDEGLNGLAYDDYTKTLYAAGSHSLYTIDMETGLASLVGYFDGEILIVGIAFDSLGNLYGECIATDSLYSIDKKTCEAILIGSFGGEIDLNYAQDMAIDKETDVCFLAAFTIYPEYEGALYTCDLTTGKANKVDIFGYTLTEISGFTIPYEYEEIAPVPIVSFRNMKGGFLCVSVSLKNTGNETAYDIEWSMNMTGGLIISPKDLVTGTIDLLYPDQEETIKIKPVISLGKSKIIFICKYRLENEYRCDSETESKQEWNNLGLLVINSISPAIQYTKEWVRIDEFKYKNLPDLHVELKKYGINKMHNVRVHSTFSSSILYMGACCFASGIGVINECHITKPALMSGDGYWEIELVNGA
jgi:hypothetical protein